MQTASASWSITAQKAPPWFKTHIELFYFIHEHTRKVISKSHAVSMKITGCTKAPKIGILSVKAPGPYFMTAEISRAYWAGRAMLQNEPNKPQSCACWDVIYAFLWFSTSHSRQIAEQQAPTLLCLYENVCWVPPQTAISGCSYNSSYISAKNSLCSASASEALETSLRW